MKTERVLKHVPRVARVHIDKPAFERAVRRMVRLPDIEQAILVVRRRGGQQVNVRLDKERQFGADLAMLEIAKADGLYRLFDSWS